MDIVKEEVVSNSEAKEIMDERAKDKNMAYEQKICSEYLDKIPTLPRAKAEKMKEELAAFPSLKPVQIAMIINILPESQEEIFMALGKDIASKDDVEKIIEIVRKYRPKKLE